MAELKYKLTNDGLFKLMFVKYPDLLKRLVAELLGIRYKSIKTFKITKIINMEGTRPLRGQP